MKHPREIRGLPDAISIRPIEILHSAGRLTAGTDGPLSPVSALWPVVRYAWVFDTTGSHLRLTSDALALRARLRGALSETLGVGLSALLARAALRAEYGDCSVEFADAEMAVGEEAMKAAGQSLSVRQRGSVCPDYLSAASDGEHTILGLGTLESKGLFDAVQHGPSAAALDQLRDATVQTQGLQVADRILSGYGFCACVAESDNPQYWGGALSDLDRGEVFVLGVDPEGREAPFPPGEGPVVRRPGGAWAIRDRATFERSLFDAGRAQLLLWAGDDDAAREVLRERPPERRGPRRSRTSTRADSLGIFEGVELQLGGGGGEILRVFTGVDREVLAAARAGNVDELRARRRDRRLSGGADAADPGENDVALRRAVSVDEDGTRLEVELAS